VHQLHWVKHESFYLARVSVCVCLCKLLTRTDVNLELGLPGRGATTKKWTFRQGTKSQRCKAQRAAARGRKGRSRGRMLRPGWVWGGALSPSQTAKKSGECCKLPQQGSRRSRDRPMIFRCFGHWKMPLLNKKCDWAFVNWQYSAKNRTLHCPVWAENYDWTLPKKPDSPVKNRTLGNPTWNDYVLRWTSEVIRVWLWPLTPRGKIHGSAQICVHSLIENSLSNSCTGSRYAGVLFALPTRRW